MLAYDKMTALSAGSQDQLDGMDIKTLGYLLPHDFYPIDLALGGPKF